MLQNRSQDAVEGARWLGAASIGLGICQLVHPQCLENMMGIEDNQTNRGILRVLGLRELMHGVGILSEDEPNRRLCAGLWSRVAGDILDGALLAVAATKTKRPARFAAVATAIAAMGIADCYYASKTTAAAAARRRFGMLYR